MDSFTWTGGEDQTDDPTWICDLIADGQVKFVNQGTPDVRLRFMGAEIEPGTTITKTGNSYVFSKGQKYKLAYANGENLSLDDMIEALQQIPEPLTAEQVRSALAKIQITFFSDGDTQIVELEVV